MHCSTSGFPILHCLPEFAQTHVHNPRGLLILKMLTMLPLLKFVNDNSVVIFCCSICKMICDMLHISCLLYPTAQKGDSWGFEKTQEVLASLQSNWNLIWEIPPHNFVSRWLETHQTAILTIKELFQVVSWMLSNNIYVYLRQFSLEQTNMPFWNKWRV